MELLVLLFICAVPFVLASFQRSGEAVEETRRLKKRVEKIERELSGTEELAPEPKVSPTPTTPKTPPPPIGKKQTPEFDWVIPLPMPEEVQEEKVEQFQEEVQPTPAKTPEVVKPQVPVAAAPKPKPKKAKKPSLSTESLVGGRYMAWAGAAISILGVCFFLKVLYDQGLIGPAGRIGIAYAFGTGALIIGARQSVRKHTSFANVVLGLGFSVYYCAAFFAYNIYDLWDSQLSWIMTSLTTIGAFVSALRVDSQKLGVFALGGAFTSLLMLESYEEPTAFVFINLGILNAVAISLTLRKSWEVLAMESLWGTLLVGAAWYLNQNPQEALMPATIATAVFSFLFMALPTLRLKNDRTDFKVVDHLFCMIAGGFAFFSFLAILPFESKVSSAVALTLQSIATGGLMLAALSRATAKSNAFKHLAIQFFLVTGFSIVRTCHVLDASILAPGAAHAALVVLLVVVSNRTQTRALDLLCFMFLGIVGLELVSDIQNGGLQLVQGESIDWLPVFNTRFLTWQAISAALLTAYTVVRNDKKNGTRYVLLAVALVTSVTSLHIELAEFFSYAEFKGWDLFLTRADSLALLWAGIVVSAEFANLRLIGSQSRTLPRIVQVFGLVSSVAVLGQYGNGSFVFMLNQHFLSRLTLSAALLWASWPRVGGENRFGKSELIHMSIVGFLALLHVDMISYYRLPSVIDGTPLLAFKESLCLLWIGIVWGAGSLEAKYKDFSKGVGTICAAILAAFVLLLSFEPYQLGQNMAIFNVHFMIRAALVASVFHLSLRHSRVFPGFTRFPLSFGAYVGFLVLLHVELAAAWMRAPIYAVEKWINFPTLLCVVWSMVLPVLSKLEEKLSGKRNSLFDTTLLFCGFFVLMVSFVSPQDSSNTLFLNPGFLARVSILAAAFRLVWHHRAEEQAMRWRIFEVLLHGATVALCAWELLSSHGSAARGIGLEQAIVSVLWSVHALILIWLGLRYSCKRKRTLGLVLFAMVVLKVLFNDTVGLEAMSRVLSFVGAGLLLLYGSYLYNRFEAMLSPQSVSGGDLESSNDSKVI